MLFCKYLITCQLYLGSCYSLKCSFGMFFLLRFVNIFQCSWMIFSYVIIRMIYRKNIGSSEFWSDNNASQLRSLTKCHTEGRRVRRDIKASTGSHGGTVGAWSDGDSLLILLAIYIQSVHTKRFIRNLYATPPSLFVPSAPP